MRDDILTVASTSDLHQSSTPHGIVFVIAGIVSARQRDAVRSYAHDLKLDCEFWVRSELDARVKAHPNILAEFFDLSPAGGAAPFNKSTTNEGPIALPDPRRHLPQGFVPGRDEERLLRDALTGDHRSVVLTGSGGFGKTCLAEWAVNQEPIRQAFPDGIIWIELGTEPNLSRCLADAYTCVDGRPPPVTGVPALSAAFADALCSRRVLVVVDDLWEASHLDPFIGLGNKESKLLVTTRFRFTGLRNSLSVLVAEVTDAIARSIILEGLAQTRTDDVEPLVARVKGWPLLAHLMNRSIAAEISYGSSTTDALEVLTARHDERGPGDFDFGSGYDRRRAVGESVEVGLAQLVRRRPIPGVRDPRAAFIGLAVFPPDVRVPQDVLSFLWKSIGAIEVDSAGPRLARELFERGLVQRLHADNGDTVLELHDEIRGYLRQTHGELIMEFGRQLLGASRPPLGWQSLSSASSYWWHHLAWHLRAIDAAEELQELLNEPNYLVRKIAVAGVGELLRDISIAKTSDPAVVAIARVLRQSSACFDSRQEADLTATLASRVANVRILEGLRRQLHAMASRPWLLPLRPLPDLADELLDRALVGVGGALAVEWSPDSRYLATVPSNLSDWTVWIWEPENDDRPPFPVRHDWEVSAIEWSPNSKRLATSDGTAIRVVDLESTADGPVLIADGGVERLGWSPDSRYIVTGGLEVDNHCWDVTDVSARPLTFVGPYDLDEVVWSPSGDRFAIDSYDWEEEWTIRVWVIDHPEYGPIELVHPGPIFVMSFSPNGDVLATADTEGILRCWQTTPPGRCLKEFIHGEDEEVDFIDWDADGEVITAGVTYWSKAPGPLDERVDVSQAEIEAQCEVVLRRVADDGTKSTRYGTRIASAGRDGIVRVWDLRNPFASPVELPHPAGIEEVSWRPNGERLATAGTDGVVRVWDPRIREESLHPTVRSLEALVWSPVGTHFITWGDHDDLADATVRIGDALDVSAPSMELQHPKRIWGASWSPTADGLFTMDGHAIRRWRLDDSGARLIEEQSVEAWKFLHIEWAADGGWVAAWRPVFNNIVRVWDPTTSVSNSFELIHSADVKAVAWSPNGSHLATASGDVVRLWSRAEWRSPIAELAHSSRIDALSWSPTGAALAVSVCGEVWVWERAPGQLPPKRLSVGLEFIEVCWTPCGRRLAAWSEYDDEPTIHIWDLSDSPEWSLEVPQTAPIHGVTWLSLNRLVVSTEDRVIAVWEGERKERLCELVISAYPGKVKALSSHRFVFTSAAGPGVLELIE